METMGPHKDHESLLPIPGQILWPNQHLSVLTLPQHLTIFCWTPPETIFFWETIDGRAHPLFQLPVVQ